MRDIRRLELRDEANFINFQRILLDEQRSGNDLIQVKKIDDFKAFVEKSKKFETKTDDPDWSTSTNYYYFLDGEIVARIGCRWELKGKLKEVGGHIGYVTRTDKRGQGIMSELLDFALKKYYEKGIHQVLITVRSDNIPSQRTIEKAGGVFESCVSDDGFSWKRYWVATDGDKGERR